MFSHALAGFATHHRSTPQPEGRSAELERRRALRVDLPFPVTVRGPDALGDHFTSTTVLDNLSACGLYFCLPRPVAPGAKLFLVVRLVPGPELGPGVAMRGVVVRAELLPDGRYGVAVAFDQHRFLYSPC